MPLYKRTMPTNIALPMGKCNQLRPVFLFLDRVMHFGMMASS